MFNYFYYKLGQYFSINIFIIFDIKKNQFTEIEKTQ